MTNKEIFNQHYRCHIETTDRVAYYQRAGIVQVGAGPNATVISPSETKVVAIYMPEDMVDDLINTIAEMVKEAQHRTKDERLMKMYSEYKTLYNLLK